MKCPNDNATLLITERKGIEIDYCPECRGVWLDRGELDKLINSSEPALQPKLNDEPKYREPHYSKNDDYRYKKKKRESFLGDLFDF